MFRTVLVLSFVLNQLAFAENAPARAHPLTPLEAGVGEYNLIRTAPRLFLMLKVGANTSDEPFLDQMAEKYKGVALPKATAKNGMVYIDGLAKPIQIVDLKKSQFSYDGKVFDIAMKDGYEAGFAALDKIFFPKSPAMWSWILPQAYAAIDSSVLIGAGIAIAGGAIAWNTCGGGDNHSDLGCGLGAGLGAGGLVYALMMAFGNNSPPTNVSCYPGQMGCSQTVVMSAGRPYTISQCPGQPYGFSPALSQVPPAQAQMFGSQMNSICSYPGQLGAVNTALASPPMIPLSTAPAMSQVRTLPTPYPVQAVRVQSTALKPTAVVPALAPQTTTPANPAGGAAK